MPILLKVFLSAVAVIDDLGAIVIIALFYTAKLSTAMLAAAGVLVVLLAILNRFGARNLGLYLLLGLHLVVRRTQVWCARYTLWGYRGVVYSAA